jgi:Xaa-Pro dipeptidase
MEAFQVTPAAELRLRASRLQAIMRAAGLDGVMATHNPDVFYLTGIVQQAQVYVPAQGEPLLMVRKHHGRASQASQLPQGRVVPVRSLKELPALIQAAGSSVGNPPARIGFEIDTLPVAVFNAYAAALQPLGTKLADASMLLRQVRSVKSEYELAQIRRAADVAETGLRAAAKHLREGATEIEVAAQVEAAMRVAGHSGAVRIRAYGQEMHMGHLLAAESGALPSFMNSPTGGRGPGPWAPYGAGSRPIRRGEPVYLDYTGEWGGYLADQTRVLSVGQLSGFWQDAYGAMREVQSHLESKVRPGTTSGQVYEAALERARALGYGDNFMGPPEEQSPGQRVPFVGHAVGLELDEWPPLQQGTTAPLQRGMVLAIEPKLIFAGPGPDQPRGAIGLEDTYLLTDDGLSPLTHSSREIVVV